MSAKTSTPTSTPTLTSTPTPTPTSTPTPTPTPTPTLSPEEEKQQELLNLAPEITGLSKKIQDGKVTYIAKAKNEYDLNEGAFSGIYVPNIWVEEKQVGGVSLQPGIVKVLLADALTKIPNGEDKMKIILPLDVTKLTQEDSIKVNDCEFTYQSADTNETFIYENVLVTFSIPIEILNPIVNEITYNPSTGINADVQLMKKDNSSILMKVATTAGITPENALIEKSEIDPENAMEEFFYLFDVIDRSEIHNLPYKEYISGEDMNVHANSMLMVCYDYFSLEGDESFISTSDLLSTNDGVVVFTYPQQDADISPTP